MGMLSRLVPHSPRKARHALEPVIDKATMQFHHDAHHAKYVALTNQYFGRTPADLTDIMTNTNTFYNKVPQTHTGAGGHYNHCFFWQCMAPVAQAKSTSPSPALQKAIEKEFGSMEGMKTEFKQAALDRFGAGWAWLAVNYDAFTGKSDLLVTSSPNQDNPLMLGSNSLSTLTAEKDGEAGIPILGLDVWEHAYYPQYQAKRAKYVDAWWSVVNWDNVNKNYEQAANGMPVKVGGINPEYLAAGGVVVRV